MPGAGAHRVNGPGAAGTGPGSPRVTVAYLVPDVARALLPAPGQHKAAREGARRGHRAVEADGGSVTTWSGFY